MPSSTGGLTGRKNVTGRITGATSAGGLTGRKNGTGRITGATSSASTITPAEVFWYRKGKGYFSRLDFDSVVDNAVVSDG